MTDPKPSSGDKLDTIIHHLERMDRRDRLRMIGGTIRSILGFIPLLLLLGSLWYLYTNSAVLFKKITEEAAKQAAGYTQQSGGDFLKELQKMMGQ